MIVRKGHARSKTRDEPDFGVMQTASFSDTGGLTQYGAYLQTLQPGAKSSTRHWHEKEDEFLFVVSGQVTDVCHYPDAGKTLYTEGETWRIEDAEGQVLRSGRVEAQW